MTVRINLPASNATSLQWLPAGETSWWYRSSARLAKRGEPKRSPLRVAKACVHLVIPDVIRTTVRGKTQNGSERVFEPFAIEQNGYSFGQLKFARTTEAMSAVSKGRNGNRMLSGNSQFISLIGVCEKHSSYVMNIVRLFTEVA